MQRRSTQEWIRLSMRTPGIFIFGLVMSPCGWILNLTSTVAPNWRTLNNLPNLPPSKYIEQGIWDVCLADTTTTSPLCGQTDVTYRNQNIITIAQGLMVASLVVTLIGLAVAIPGVRCWRDNPNWIVAALGGVLIFLSGVMVIIPISWYTNKINNVTSDYSINSVSVGYCIVLGYIGGIFEVLGGFVMWLGICRCCGGWNRGETRVKDVIEAQQQRPPTRPNYVPRTNGPRSSARSGASSSVPYSRDDLDDDVSFPRAKSPAARSANVSHSGRPYDADL